MASLGEFAEKADELEIKMVSYLNSLSKRPSGLISRLKEWCAEFPIEGTVQGAFSPGLGGETSRQTPRGTEEECSGRITSRRLVFASLKPMLFLTPINQNYVWMNSLDVSEVNNCHVRSDVDLIEAATLNGWRYLANFGVNAVRPS